MFSWVRGGGKIWLGGVTQYTTYNNDIFDPTSICTNFWLCVFPKESRELKEYSGTIDARKCHRCHNVSDTQ